MWPACFEAAMCWIFFLMLLNQTATHNGRHKWPKWWVCCEAHDRRYFGLFATVIRSKGCLILQTSESWELSVCEFLQLWHRAYSGGWVYFCQCSYKMGYTWFFELLLVFCCILQVFLLFKCCQDFQCSCRRKSKRMSGEVLKSSVRPQWHPRLRDRWSWSEKQ